MGTRDILFVSCTRGRKEDTDLHRSLQRLGADRAVFFDHNQTGLPARYNSVLDERRGRDEIVVFAHDDIVIGDLYAREKLSAAFETQGYAIAGLAGTAHFTIDPGLQTLMWLQPPHDACSGAVEHATAGPGTAMSVYGPTPRRCVVLDGLFLALDLKTIGDLRFDEQFAFHFYDLDFCLAAHRAGLALGTTNVYVTHRSGGSYTSQAFKDAQVKFRSKWRPGVYRVDNGQPQSALAASAMKSEWREALGQLPLCLPTSAWSGHIPFLFLLLKLARPRIFVELGVDLGASFLAACEATLRFGTNTRCTGVDTWRGDEHAGFIDGDRVFEPLLQLVAARYPDGTLVRDTFDRAVARFDDGSVDLLHIDGLHTYEAVANDFATWLPKLSNRSIVLFHDTQVRAGDFGVWKFWSEITQRYRHVEFPHSFGLGVLFTGPAQPQGVDELMRWAATSQDHARQLLEACRTAGAELPMRLASRGPATIPERAALERLVLHKSGAVVTALPRATS